MENKKNPKEQSSVKDTTSNSDKSKSQDKKTGQNLTNQSETWNQESGKSGEFSSQNKKGNFQQREEQEEQPIEDLDSTTMEDDTDESQKDEPGNFKGDKKSQDRDKKEPYKGL